jgi:hypothetical protein
MSPCEVLAVDRDSYVCAVVALQTVIDLATSDTQLKADMSAALSDFRRAHAYSMAVDAQIHTPALLRRQI